MRGEFLTCGIVQRRMLLALGGGVLFSVLLVLAPPGASAKMEMGEPVEFFALKTLDGRVFDLEAELKGKVALISFWRADQKYSMRMLKDLVKIDAELGAEGVEVISVVCDESGPDRLAKIVAEIGAKFPVLLDPQRKLYGSLGVIVCPSSWFIDRGGILRFSYPGHRRDFLVATRSNLAFLLGRISEDERAAQAVHGGAPRSEGTVGAPVLYRLARRLLAAGKRDAARKELTRAWEADPRAAEAGVDLGLLLLEDGKEQEALDILEQATDLLPEDPRALGAKGVAMVRTGHQEEGEKLLRRALEKRVVVEPMFYYEIATLSEKKGLTDEALRYYKQGLEIAIEGKRSSKGSASFR